MLSRVIRLYTVLWFGGRFPDYFLLHFVVLELRPSLMQANDYD